MNRSIVCTVFAALVAAAFVASADAHDKKNADKNSNLGKLRHVVCFKFKDGTSDAKIKEIEKGFLDLPKKIDSIVDFEWGTNVSEEGHDQGFTHCFLVTFKDKKGREKYLPHPAHKAFVKMLLPSLDKVFVIDYVAK